jgi:DNA-binding MarR family transcriptional regulator
VSSWHPVVKKEIAMTHTKSGRIFTELILETFRLNGALIEAGDKLISDLGLTSARWQVLGSLMDEPITVAEIARRMGLSRQNVKRIANRLEQDGFIDTSPNPAHRRAKLYFLTPFGIESMREVTNRQGRWVNQISKNMELVEISQTVSVMIDCRQQVQKSLEGMQNDNGK